jgi:alpha-glucosidase
MEDVLPYDLESIHHDGSPRYVRSAGGSDLRLGDEVVLRLRAGHAAPIERILLRTCPDGEQEFVEMQLEDSPTRAAAACRWWRANLRLNMPVTSYRFLLFTREGAWWYNGSGLHRYLPTDAEDFRLLAGYQAPAWVRDSVFYQIFPDRFADGEPANNVRDGEFEYRGYKARLRRWGEKPSSADQGALVEFFGGDLAGIGQRLDYLSDLGVNALYLNPIFTAFSNHRYDVTDYEQVDPHLGGNPALAALRAATSDMGMHFILDIVPNHCGVLHPWFQTALNSLSAPTVEYFTFFHHPDDYACWLGVKSLPKLNYRSQALRQVMYSAPGSIFRHWLRPPYSIDGWRLDVANMLARQGADQLGPKVGRGIRQAVKEENPQAYILGENFFDGSAQLQGDMWDATMNYAGFSTPLQFWLTGFHVNQHGNPVGYRSEVPWTTQALVASWQASLAAIPWVIARQQYNLLGSHDTPRILSLLNGNATLNRLAVGLLLTYVGVPSVYYGDEIGLGKKAGETRLCMDWQRGNWDEDLHSFYRDLIAIRRSSPALVEGGFQVLLAEADTLAYLRDTDDQQIVVLAQRGPGIRLAEVVPVAKAAIPDGTQMVELLTRRIATVINGNLPLPTLQPGIQIWATGK